MVSLDMMLTLAYSMFENLYYDSGLTSPRRAGVTLPWGVILSMCIGGSRNE